MRDLWLNIQTLGGFIAFMLPVIVFLVIFAAVVIGLVCLIMFVVRQERRSNRNR